MGSTNPKDKQECNVTGNSLVGWLFIVKLLIQRFELRYMGFVLIIAYYDTDLILVLIFNSLFPNMRIKQRSML